MITLTPLTAGDAEAFCAMQREAFLPLYARYRDDQHSPAMETAVLVAIRINAPLVWGFFIDTDGQRVGGAIVRQSSPTTMHLIRIFVLPAQQGQGIATHAIHSLEALFPQAKTWTLDTIWQEKGNCHLYRKLGYR